MGALRAGVEDLEDALEIRRRILLAFEKAEREWDSAKRQAFLTFVVVGAGPTGVELSGAIAEISREVLVDDFRAINPREARVLLLEAGPRVLSAYSEQSSANAVRELERKGVQVRTGTAVSRIDGGGVEAGGERIEAATVLWAAGVAASPLARSLGVALDRAGRVPRGAGPDGPRPSGDLGRRRSRGSLRRTESPFRGPRPSRSSRAATPRRTSCGRLGTSPPSPSISGTRGPWPSSAARPPWPRSRGSGSRGRRVARLVLRPHLLPDRLPQPLRRDVRVGLGLHDGHRGARLITGRIDEPRPPDR